MSRIDNIKKGNNFKSISMNPEDYKSSEIDDILDNGGTVEVIKEEKEVVVTRSNNNDMSEERRKPEKFNSRNFKGNNKKVYNDRNGQYNKISNREQEINKSKIGGITMDIKTNLGSPLSISWAKNSIELAQAVRGLLRQELPELEKCAKVVTVTPFTISEKTDGGIIRKKETAKVTIKCDFSMSDVLNKKRNTYTDPDEDEIYAKMLDRVTNSSNIKGDMPKYIQDNGKDVLFNDYYDILDYIKYRDAKGKVWDSLVMIEFMLDVAIVKMLGLSNKEYSGFVEDVKRVKELEEKIRNKNRSEGKNIPVPAIYLCKLTVDQIETVNAVAKIFKKVKPGQFKNNKSGLDSAKANFFA